MFNTKNTSPSASMYLKDQSVRKRCRWIESSVTVLSDGNVTCGLDDAHSLRSFGNLLTTDLNEIRKNPEYETIISKLGDGHQCNDCTLYEPSSELDPPKSVSEIETLVVESTVACNLRCPNDACIPNNSPLHKTRDKESLKFTDFERIVDEMPTSLKQVYFMNYGEPFFHRDAGKMLNYLREKFPKVTIFTSTNGIPLSKQQKAEEILKSNIDLMTFTISGINQESYAKYHVGGDVHKALQGLKHACDLRDKFSLNTKIVWRYLLFRWNDSEEEINRAINLAKEFRVDQFSLYLTHIPVGAGSYRLGPASPLFPKYKSYIDYVHGLTTEHPSSQGVYKIETWKTLGDLHWTAHTVSLSTGNSNWIKISLSSNQKRRDLRNFKLHAPWITLSGTTKFLHWDHIVLRIPPKFRGSDCNIYLEFKPWFPAEELANEDLRCLGAVIKSIDVGRKDISFSDIFAWLKGFFCFKRTGPTGFALKEGVFSFRTQKENSSSSGQIRLWGS